MTSESDPEAMSRLEDAKAAIANQAEFEKRFYDLAAGALERAKGGAETVQKASAAIVVLYTGLLGLVYSTDGTAFPLRGLIAPLFLGAAVVLSTFYLAFISRRPGASRDLPVLGTPQVLAEKRLKFFMEYVSEMVSRRTLSLRLAVLCLGVGLVAMTLPFVSSSTFSDAVAAADDQRIEVVWPDAPTGMPDSVAAVLMKAQVDDAVAAAEEKREAHGAVGPGVVESGWFAAITFLLGAAVVGFGAITGTRTPRAERRA